MNIKRALWLVAVFIPFLIMASCQGAESTPAPKITLSAERIPEKGHVEVHGTGFTPHANIKSHLRRPNNTEFPVLLMLTNDNGEFTHDIDTLLLDGGVHEIWVVDSTGVSSNVATFDVTHGQ